MCKTTIEQTNDGSKQGRRPPIARLGYLCRFNSFGSFAIFAGIRRASSYVTGSPLPAAVRSTCLPHGLNSAWCSCWLARHLLRRLPMATHKFRVGQIVLVKPDHRNVPGGAYAIIKKMPERDGEFEYCVKSTNETHERVVRESQMRIL